jgi:hypothetical protein
MKAALISIMGNVGSTFNTQGGGYGLICTKMVKDLNPQDTIDVNPDPSTWGDYEKLYVCEGVNFVDGSFNVPGGPQPIHTQKMEAISKFEGEFEFVNKTFDFRKFNQRIKVDSNNWPISSAVDYFSKPNPYMVIGDSHSLSVWKPGYALSFNQGKTLHGWLKHANAQAINQLRPGGVVLYFGNIDLRFHLGRMEDPYKATEELFTKYVNFAKELNHATLVQLLPVEHESRKIPGTGLYKGQPFYGTRQLRMELRDIANEIIAQSGLDYISWTQDWVDSDGTKMLDVLESKQSVHIKPKYYPYLQEILS